MQERGIDIRRLSPEAIDNIMSRYEERIEQQAARIKELESEITAWVADRDSWIARYEAVREEALREMAEPMAREALERIKADEKL